MKVTQPGVTAFTELSDVPHSYLGEADQHLAVNALETGIDFVPGGGGGSAVWGGITGTLSDQTDLQTALDGLVPYVGANQDITFDGSAERTIEVGASLGSGNSIYLRGGAGAAGDNNGGHVYLLGGNKTGAGIGGDTILQPGTGGVVRIVDTSVANDLTLITSGLTFDRTQTFPDKDGTFAMLSDITGGGGIAGQATVNFGAVTTEDSIATTTVSTTSVLTTSIIQVSPAGVATTDHDPDDYQWDNISAYVSNIINGVSFDIIGVAPNGSWGQYKFNYLIN